MDIIYISDFFVPEVSGGAEQNDAELLELLRKRGHSVTTKKSDDLNPDFILKNKESKFIISNFVFMFKRMQDFIQENCEYILYTHDHQYLATRDPSPYAETEYVAPKEELVNVEFYAGAKAVFCQSALHSEIVFDNLDLITIYNLGGNLWKEETLDLLEELADEPKRPCASIMQSMTLHKNTSGAVQYCQKTGMEFDLLMPQTHEDFLRAMSANDTFVFFPRTVETLSRIVCEARMMNCDVKTNTNIGAASEPWFQIKGKELITVMRNKREEIPALVEEIFNLPT